jgi:hypothetical protein
MGAAARAPPTIISTSTSRAAAAAVARPPRVNMGGQHLGACEDRGCFAWERLPCFGKGRRCVRQQAGGSCLSDAAAIAGLPCWESRNLHQRGRVQRPLVLHSAAAAGGAAFLCAAAAAAYCFARPTYMKAVVLRASQSTYAIRVSFSESALVLLLLPPCLQLTGAR